MPVTSARRLAVLLLALVGVLTPESGRAIEPNNGGDNVNLADILHELQSMRSEHTAELDRLQQAHAQEMKELRTALDVQRQQLESMVTPSEPLQRRRLDDFSEFSGIAVKQDKAKVSFGSDLDVHIMRSRDGVLEIIASDFIVHGTLHAKAIMVNDTDLADYISAASTHTITVEVLTSLATSSDTVDTIYAEFYLPNLASWSSKLTLLEGSDQEELHEATFTLPDIPTQIRLSGSGNDAWGFQQLAVYIDEADEMIIVCPGIVGSHPAMGANGHWIDGDGSNGAPTTVTHDISPACATEVTVTAETGALTSSDTTNTVYVAFYLADTDEWTDPLALFAGSSIGDVESETYGLASTPSQIAFTISSTDAWGFDYLDLEIDGYTFVLSCDGDQSSMSSSSEHWVDGDASGGVTDELILDIAHTDCDSS